VWIDAIDWHFWQPPLMLAAVWLILEMIGGQLRNIDVTLTRLMEAHLSDHDPLALDDRWQPNVG